MASFPAVMLHENSSIHTLVDESIPPINRIKEIDDPKLATLKIVEDFNRPSIEFEPALDDPRLWSDRKKTFILALLSASSLAGNLGGSILFPAISSLQDELEASDALIAASVSLFVLGQG